VDDEPEVGLVEAHPEGAGRHESLQPVAQQVVLCLPALGVIALAAVRGSRDAP